MSTVEQRRAGAFLSRHFAGGSGPTHADVTTAMGICGYQENSEARGGSKQSRVFEAFQNATREQAVCLVQELVTMLLAGVDLDNIDQSDYGNLIDTLDWADLELAPDQIYGEHRVVAQSKVKHSIASDNSTAPNVDDPDSPSTHTLSEAQQLSCNVFISHATADSDLALQVARYLRTSCNLPEETILCTSARGFGLPTGASWSDALREALVDSALVVFLLSEDFLESRFCGYEMGAVWIAKKSEQRFPIRLPGVDANILGSLAGAWQAPELSSDALQELAERVAKLRELPVPHPSSLSRQVNEFFPKLT